MAQQKLTPTEMRFLEEALRADYETVNIRLREGEYQYTLAKAIASFQLELYFPDVKDITRRLYGEEKASDTQFIRKIQTILKKMEKSEVVRILKKKKPWELQRYALTSFKFQDVDKNPVILATDQQIGQMENLLRFVLRRQERPKARLGNIVIKICILVFIIVASYAVILWDLMQHSITLLIFVPVFSIAVGCSLILGKILSQRQL